MFEVNRSAALLAIALLAIPLHAQDSAENQTRMSPEATTWLRDFCVDCHSGESAEGGLSLDAETVNWASETSRDRWQTVHQYVSRGIMPPTDAEQPDGGGRKGFLTWLDNELDSNLPIGGDIAAQAQSTRVREHNPNGVRASQISVATWFSSGHSSQRV